MKTVLFDLDGTILPIDQEEFIQKYFQKITSRIAKEKQMDPEHLTKVIWSGTKGMVKNDGTKMNRDCFYEIFEELTGEKTEDFEPAFDDFYEREFDELKEIMKESYNSKKMIARLKEKGHKVILATAPVFPRVAVNTRLSWVGLSVNDFDYVTSYENSSYCKPSKKYYQEILERNHAEVEDCVMIGNNVREDMVAKELGMEVFLLTDFLENPEDQDISQYRNGNAEDLLAFVESL